MNIRMSAWALLLLFVPGKSRAVTLSMPATSPVSAEAEVSAAKPPVMLTLSVYKTTLKRHDDFKTEMDLKRPDREHPRGNNERAQDGGNLDRHEHQVPIKVSEHLWIKISIKNIGEKEMFILDDLFTGRMNFRKAIGNDGRYGVKVVITGADGKTVPGENPFYIPAGPCPGQRTSTVDIISTKKVAAWKKEGKTDAEIDELLDRQVQDERKTKEAREQAHRPIIKLAPGKSISTGPWHKIQCPGERGWFPPQIGDFAELWNYHLDTPGVYKIKAVYFDDPFRARGGSKIQFETPQIQVTVLP